MDNRSKYCIDTKENKRHALQHPHGMIMAGGGTQGDGLRAVAMLVCFP